MSARLEEQTSSRYPSRVNPDASPFLSPRVRLLPPSGRVCRHPIQCLYLGFAGSYTFFAVARQNMIILGGHCLLQLSVTSLFLRASMHPKLAGWRVSWVEKPQRSTSLRPSKMPSSAFEKTSATGMLSSPASISPLRPY